MLQSLFVTTGFIFYGIFGQFQSQKLKVQHELQIQQKKPKRLIFIAPVMLVNKWRKLGIKIVKQNMMTYEGPKKKTNRDYNNRRW